MNNRIVIVYVTLVSSLFALTGCQTAPYTGRSQLIMMSESEEIKMGEDSWKELLSKSKLSNDSKQNAAVKKVGESIAKIVKNKPYKWEFVVIESPEANAFCLPGGKVAVYSGLFKHVANDSELAAVVAHEIGHAVARHGAERMTASMGQQLIGTALGAALQANEINPDIWLQAYGAGSNVAAMLPFSREQEYEADYMGLMMMSEAGYDPNGALTFWEKFSKENEQPSIMEFLSTHPISAKRIENIKKNMPKAMTKYARK